MKKILRFTASWCQPCKGLEMNLNSAKIDLPVEVIDIEKYADLATHWQIRSVPTLLMLDGETELKRSTGVLSTKQLEEWAK
jgi:thioredoxin-like negative regulator of GroEL